MDDPNYDYRGAFKSGADFSQTHGPSRSPTGQWFKGPKHPTAWKEYMMDTLGINPDEAGVGQEEFERILK